MIRARDLAGAEETLGLLDPDGPLLRLAELLSPASLIEPELMRHMRLAYVRDAGVEAEQELWFSDLVRARSGQGISLRVAVSHLLRERLKQRVAVDGKRIAEARDLMARVHAQLSPVLLMEETLAWAEVFEQTARIQSRADDLLNALAAGREGLDHWLGRAWGGLPEALKKTEAGRNLAQVAAMRGADVEPADVDELDASRVAHLLDRVTVFLARQGSWLSMGVPPSQATHMIEVPDTAPLMVEAVFDRGGTPASERFEVRPDAPPLDVGTGAVTLRCVDGSEYRLKPVQRQEGEHLSIEMLAAGTGVCLLLRYGDPAELHHVVVDGGPNARVARQLFERLEVDRVETDFAVPTIELLVVTHIDADRIRGVLSLLEETSLDVRDVWFNGVAQAPTEFL